MLSLLSRLSHPVRRIPNPKDPTEEEVEAWVESAALEYFSNQDHKFVQRALGLGVNNGMVLDVGSRLGLVPLKILWEKDEFFGIGLQPFKRMADRAIETAKAWELNERMFFHVGNPHQIKFKDAYFDLVISDAALCNLEDPLGMLIEINRVAKPSGAILIRDLVRPSRLRRSSYLANHRSHYKGTLQSTFETSIGSSFTQREIVGLIKKSGLRARVSSDHTHVFIERRGSNDPSSWVTEREKYF